MLGLLVLSSMLVSSIFSLMLASSVLSSAGFWTVAPSMMVSFSDLPLQGLSSFFATLKDVHEGDDVWVSLLRVRLLHVVEVFCHHAPFVSCFRCNFHQEPFGALEDLVLRVQQEERLHDAALRGDT